MLPRRNLEATGAVGANLRPFPFGGSFGQLRWSPQLYKDRKLCICSEDDLRSRIFGTFIACLPAPPRIFEHLKNSIIAHF